MGAKEYACIGSSTIPMAAGSDRSLLVTTGPPDCQPGLQLSQNLTEQVPLVRPWEGVRE